MYKALDRVELWYNGLLKLLISLVAASIGLFALSIPLNLLLIKQHWGAIWWLNESIEYALYVGVFIGAPWVLQQGAHVRVDVFIAALPHRVSVRLERVLDIFGAVLCAALCFYGTRAALWEYADGTLPDKDLRIANWYMLTVFAASFFLLSLEFLFRLRRVRDSFDKPDSSTMEAPF